MASKMEEKLQNSPIKSQIEQFGKNSFRRNPYKPIVETSPVKKQIKQTIDKSPQKKPIGEASPRKTQSNPSEYSPRKKQNKPSDNSPQKKQSKLSDNNPQKKQGKLNDSSPRKKQEKVNESPRKNPQEKHKESKHSNQLQNEQFAHTIPRIKLEEDNDWVVPKKPGDEKDKNLPNPEVIKQKKKHHLIQEYNPDVHGAEFERTLAIIKPNTMTKAKSIESIIKRNGLLLLKTKRTYLKPDQVRDFYLQSLDEENNKYYRIFRELVESEGGTEKIPADLRTDGLGKRVETSNMDEYVEFMTSGPVEVLIIGGRGAVTRWLHLIGPEDPRVARTVNPDTIRARYGGESVLRNGVYGSLNAEQAEKEIKYFFPDMKAKRDDKLGASGEYLSKTVNPILLKGLIQLCRQKPDNPLVWLADWLLANNPNAKST